MPCSPPCSSASSHRCTRPPLLLGLALSWVVLIWGALAWAAPPVRGQALPVQTLPAQTLPGQTLPVQTLLAQPLPAFSATFIQLWDRHNDWPEETWDGLCADLAAMGVREIILQWSLITEPAFLWRLTPDRRMEVPHDLVEPTPAVDLIVEAARGHGLRVRFGLSEDPAWWAKIKNEAGLVEVFLNRLLQDQLALASTLAERYGNDPVFAGFYIPQEIDDQTWIDQQRRFRLVQHVARLSEGLQMVAPDADLAISCFATGRDDPAGFAGLMLDLAHAGGLGQVLYQDGLGTKRLLPAESEAYLQALVLAVPQAGTRIRVVVETFAPNPAGEGLIPGTMHRIARQLQLALALTDGDVAAFSIPDYVHPLAGPKADVLYREYVEYLQSLTSSKAGTGFDREIK